MPVTPQPSRTTPGSRRYRTTLALTAGAGIAESALTDVHARVRVVARPDRLVSITTVQHRPDWPELEFELCSSEADDDYDIGAVTALRLEGDRAAAYWTHPASTLTDATIAAAEILQDAVGLQFVGEPVDAVVLRTTPLGDPSQPAHITALPALPPAVPVIHLHGVPTRQGTQLVAAIRDELDDHRWGPAAQRLPTVRYDARRHIAIVTYPISPDGLLDTCPIYDALADTAAALDHLQRVLDSIGAVGCTAVETRIDQTPARGPDCRI